MSILVRWTPPALNGEQYDEAVGKLEAQGNWPPEASTTTSASKSTELST